jgi:23S rRNA pseudouridine1911/1915/1917 synthase
MGHPVVGDSVYSGKKNSFIKRYGKQKEIIFKNVKRQMLHSKVLKFSHPTTNEKMSFEAPISEDIQSLIKELITTKLAS